MINKDNWICLDLILNLRHLCKTLHRQVNLMIRINKQRDTTDTIHEDCCTTVSKTFKVNWINKFCDLMQKYNCTYYRKWYLSGSTKNRVLRNHIRISYPGLPTSNFSNSYMTLLLFLLKAFSEFAYECVLCVCVIGWCSWKKLRLGRVIYNFLRI